MDKVRHRRRTKTARFLFVVAALAALTGLSFPRRTPAAASAALEEDAVLMDFSHAGYGGGGVRVPFVPDAPRSWDKGATISKPTSEDWLLLLTTR